MTISAWLTIHNYFFRPNQLFLKNKLRINLTICVLPPWSVLTVLNSLKTSDAIWWCRSGSILAQAMACCLTTPLPELMLTSHQGGLEAFPWGQLHRKYSKYLSLMSTKNDSFNITDTSPKGQWVNGFNCVAGMDLHFVRWLHSIFAFVKVVYLYSGFKEQMKMIFFVKHWWIRQH